MEVLIGGNVVLIDEGDWVNLKDWRWYVNARSTNNPKQKVRGYQKCSDGLSLMSRVIMAPVPAGSVVDHIDGNSLNNQRANLRVCTQAQNLSNRPKQRLDFKGIRRRHNKYQAFLNHAGTNFYLGMYNTAEEAARAYDEAALGWFGEYAHVNFPAERGSFRL